MSYKIKVPTTSAAFNEWLLDYMISSRYESFWSLLNYISGEIMTLDCTLSGIGEIGGGKDPKSYIKSHIDKVLLEECMRFMDEGYSSGDFQYIFFDAYLRVSINAILNGAKLQLK